MDRTDYARLYAKDVAVAPPVGGFDNVQDALGAGGGGIYPTSSGAGSPEGAVAGAVGDTYLDTTSGFGYVKVAGAGNTGWQGPLITDVQSSTVNADAPTAVTCDGNPVQVNCAIAVPPAWMDNASQIIRPGIYRVLTLLQVTTPPTTPGKLFEASGSANDYFVNTLEAITFAGTPGFTSVVGLAVADLPFAVSSSCSGQVDATGVVTVQIGVTRLAYYVP